MFRRCQLWPKYFRCTWNLHPVDLSDTPTSLTSELEFDLCPPKYGACILDGKSWHLFITDFIITGIDYKNNDFQRKPTSE